MSIVTRSGTERRGHTDHGHTGHGHTGHGPGQGHDSPGHSGRGGGRAGASAPDADGQGTERTDILLSIDRCTGCQECVAVCASNALTLMPDTWAIEVHPNRCGGCRRCVPACPFHALEVTGPVRNRHRVVLDSLSTALSQCCPAGWQVVTSGPALQPHPQAEAVVPDLAVIRAVVPGAEWLGPEGNQVSLVVEVATSSTRSRDIGPRRDLYWQCDVPSYWTVEAGSGEVTVHWSHRPGWFDPFAAATFG